MFKLHDRDLSRVGIVVLTASCFGLAGCPPKSIIRDDIEPLESILGTGWHCLLTPSSLDKPGMLIRIDERGMKFTAHQVAKQGDVTSGTIAIGKVHFTADQSIGATAAATLNDALKAAGKEHAVHVKADAIWSSNHVVTATFEGTEKNITGDSIRKSAEEYFKQNPPIPGSNYFLLRETVTAKVIDLDLDDELVSNLGGSVTIGELASLTPSLKRNASGTYTLKGSYEPAVSACILLEVYGVTSAALDGRNTMGFIPYRGKLNITGTAD